MPDRTKLSVGDRIRVVAVPACDLAQRERERAFGTEDAGGTADTIERIIDQHPIVEISRIDEYAQPWFDVEITEIDGTLGEHTLAILDDDSWEQCS